MAGGRGRPPSVNNGVEEGSEKERASRGVSSHPTGGEGDEGESGLSQREENHRNGGGEVNGTTHGQWEGLGNEDPPLCRSL